MAISDRTISAPPACVQAQREGRFLCAVLWGGRRRPLLPATLPKKKGACHRVMAGASFVYTRFCARQGAYISPLGSRVMRAWTASAGSMPWLTMALTVWTMGMSTR